MRFDGETVSDLIGLWPEPSLTTFAADINVPTKHASAMKRRNSIPDEYRPAVTDAAQRRGIEGVTYERLTLMHARRPDALSAGAPAQ